MHRNPRLITSVTDNLPGMVGYWSCELRCLFANAAYLTWFGRTKAQMRGITMQELLGPELFAKNEPYIRAVLAGQDQQFERTLTKANGEISHTWAQYIADREDGVVCGFLVLVSDITALKEKQMQLEKVSADLRVAAIAFEAQEGILITDAAFQVLRSNSSFTRITGYPADSLVGKSAIQLRSMRHEGAYYESIFSAIAHHGKWSGELWCRHAQGHDFPVSLTAAAVANESGAITHYVFTYIDVSERYQLDEQRRKNEAIQRAALVREVHHRIKNNLQGIAGLLQRFGREHPETQAVLNLATGQLKSIATAHGLQGQSESEKVALGELVRTIAAQVGALWQVPLRINTDSMQSGELFISEDEGVPVAMILNELMINAVKHCSPNLPGVEVELSRHAHKAHATLRIRNAVAATPTLQVETLSGAGHKLMEQLMPSAGAQLRFTQSQGVMAVELVLEPPVLVLE